MRSGPEKVYRETCAHCQWQGMPEECADCPTKIAYDYIDERNARIYYTEVRHLHEKFQVLLPAPDVYGHQGRESQRQGIKKPPAV